MTFDGASQALREIQDVFLFNGHPKKDNVTFWAKRTKITNRNRNDIPSNRKEITYRERESDFYSEFVVSNRNR